MKTKLRLRVDAIEQARKARGWTQEEFAQLVGVSKRRYTMALKETREGSFPNLGTAVLDGICSTLGWTIGEVTEQIVVDK